MSNHDQDFNILICLAMAMIFCASITFWPVQTTDAAIIDQNVEISWTIEQPLAPKLSNQYDTDKLKELEVKNTIILKDIPVPLFIWRYLTDEMDLSDECAAGIFGNMMVECGGYSFDLQPTIYSPGGYYYGLCQWGTGNHHRSINGGTIEEQLEYLASTIRSEMAEYGYSAFEGATDPESAAYYFARYYERCSNPSGRGSCAIEAYERFASN